jgi:MarR family 2-MHQ and catechol resistance regulon transcriptional repressor
LARANNSGVHVWLVLWKAYESVHAYAMEHIGSLDMCMSDFAILEILLHKGSLPINEIGKRLGLASGTMTTAIDRLEQRQLVRRELSEGDRRARYVALTPTGRKLISRGFDQHSDWLESITGSLNAKEKEALISLLKKFGFAARDGLAKKHAQVAGTRGSRRM